MVTFSHITRWIINKHQHRCVQGIRSSIQVRFHFYFWPIVLVVCVVLYFFPLVFFFLKRKSSIKNFSMAHFLLRKYRKYFFTIHLHVRCCLAFVFDQRGSFVFLQRAVLQNTHPNEKQTAEKEKRMQAAYRKKINACIHSIHWHANTIHYET